MIYFEPAKQDRPIKRAYHKKYTAVITPDNILHNQNLLLTLMAAGVGLVLLSWAVRSKNSK